MVKHTPGPWYLHKRWYISSSETIYNCDSVVARVHPWDENGCREEDNANARLIAAAPDLLEALKDMIRYLDNNGKEGDVSELARAAVAKAEGSDNG